MSQSKMRRRDRVHCKNEKHHRLNLRNIAYNVMSESTGRKRENSGRNRGHYRTVKCRARMLQSIVIMSETLGENVIYFGVRQGFSLGHVRLFCSLRAKWT